MARQYIIYLGSAIKLILRLFSLPASPALARPYSPGKVDFMLHEIKFNTGQLTCYYWAKSANSLQKEVAK
jgi:hypothetical protein